MKDSGFSEIYAVLLLTLKDVKRTYLQWYVNLVSQHGFVHSRQLKLSRWVHLLKILGRLIDKREYSDSEINEMTWQKKSDLIQKDPVTCARNFEHMLRLFLHNFIKSSLNPIEVVDFFLSSWIPATGFITYTWFILDQRCFWVWEKF